MQDTQPSAAERLMRAGLERDRARFDADLGLIEERTDSGVFHPIREAFGYAYTLMQAEGDVALPTVERIIRRALQAQERQAGHIHYGGFKWMDEDQCVTDLNAVQFVLEHLLPLYIDYGGCLSPDLRAEILKAVRIATYELESLNVSVAYTSFYHATDRSRGNNLNEEGMFWGLQHENKSIAIYALLPQNEPVHSLKTEVFVLNAAGLDEIWVNNERIEQLPRELQPLDALQLADGDTFVALRPLAPSNLGRAAPIVVQERGGELVLSIYNYFQGEAKRFWEYATLRGPFYKGNIRAGFVIEVGDRAEFGDFAAFRAHIARGHVADSMDRNVRKVSYASGGDLLEIGVDLYANRLVERRVNGAIYQAAMLRSPTAVQSTAGELHAGGAKLHTSPAPAWLLADDDRACWVAAKPSDEPGPWRFETSAGSVTCAAFGFGKVVWRGRESVTIEVLSAGQFAPIRIQAGVAPLRVVWNGQDVSVECVFDRRAREHVLPPGARAGGA